MKNISKHITYKEGTYSNTANRLGLANDPTEEQLENMKLVEKKCLNLLESTYRIL